MKRAVFYLLLFTVPVFIPGCKSQPEKESKRNIILDVDMSVDDMMSILYFLSCPDIDIKAITIENGVSTVDSGAEIVLRILNLTGHPEIPVAKGTGKPLEGDNGFPEQWRPPVDKPFGLALPAHHLKPSDKSAVMLIKQIAGENKNNLTILALGPMTSLAQVFLDDPELAGTISQVFVSDGAVDVEGGIYQEWPAVNNRVSGWNLWVDAKAAAIVFNSGARLVLVPLDLTALHGRDPLVLTDGFLKQYMQLASDTIGKSMSTLMENWISSYVYSPQTAGTAAGVPVWDLVACMIFHHPEIGTKWENRCLKITEGVDEIAGQIVSSKGCTPNVRICFGGEQALLDSLLLQTAGK